MVDEGGMEPSVTTSLEQRNGIQRGNIFQDVSILRKGKLNIKLSHLYHLFFAMVGIALLWPWNSYLAASDYFRGRFSHSPTLIKLYSCSTMIVTTLPSTIFSYYLMQVKHEIDYTYRVNLGLVMTAIIFIVMSLTCTVNFFISMADNLFFSLLMLMVFISTIATCLTQNGIFAIANLHGDIYTNSVIIGQGIAGVLPSIVLIFSLLIFGDHLEPPNDPLMIQKDFGVSSYFLFATLVCSISLFLLYWTLKYNSYSYQSLNAEEARASLQFSRDYEITQKSPISFKYLWKRLKYIVMALLATFTISLVFLIFASSVTSTHKDGDNALLRSSFYIPFAYLIWNLGDLVGRIVSRPNSIFFVSNQIKLLLYSLVRVFFIPLFLTCNFRSSSGYDAIVKSDVWYLALQLLFGLSNGQLCTSCFMLACDTFEAEDEREAAGGFTIFFLYLGLALGSIFSYILVLLVY